VHWTSAVAYSAVVGAGASCSLLLPLDDLHGRKDAGSDAADAVDAQTEAAPDARYCAALVPAPLFCDDFDGPEKFGATWAAVRSSGSAFVDASMMPIKSPPLASHHSVFPHDAASWALLDYKFPGTTSKVVAAFDLFVGPRPATGQVEIAAVNLGLPSGGYYMDIELRANGNDSYHEEFGPSDGGFFGGDNAITTIPSNIWKHVQMTVDLSMKSYVLMIDGAVVSQGSARYGVAPGNVSFSSGIDYSTNVSPTWTIDIDNVSLDNK